MDSGSSSTKHLDDTLPPPKVGEGRSSHLEAHHLGPVLRGGVQKPNRCSAEMQRGKKNSMAAPEGRAGEGHSGKASSACSAFCWRTPELPLTSRPLLRVQVDHQVSQRGFQEHRHGASLRFPTASLAPEGAASAPLRLFLPCLATDSRAQKPPPPLTLGTILWRW